MPFPASAGAEEQGIRNAGLSFEGLTERVQHAASLARPRESPADIVRSAPGARGVRVGLRQPPRCAKLAAPHRRGFRVVWSSPTRR
jgi:hypothetical protein